MKITTNIRDKDILDLVERVCLFNFRNTSLFATIYFHSGGFRYEIVDNNETVYWTNYLSEAVKEYNKLMLNPLPSEDRLEELIQLYDMKMDNGDYDGIDEIENEVEEIRKILRMKGDKLC